MNVRERFFNPYSKSDTNSVWGDVQKALPLIKALEQLKNPRKIKGSKLSQRELDKIEGIFNNTEEENIQPDDKIIFINPGETILAHTNEFIGGLHNITTSMQARSSQGRSFIAVCKCAGWGDVGYVNHWTMEISNASQYYIIPLIVGRRYAQMIFDETGPINGEGYGVGGKYQQGHDIEEIKKSWKPGMMLPRLFNDRDIEK